MSRWLTVPYYIGRGLAQACKTIRDAFVNRWDMDSTEDDVLGLVDAIAATRPVTEYREPIVVRTLPFVERSPLAGPRHMGDGYASHTGYQARHRLTGPDDWRVAHLTETQVAFMDVLVDAGEELPAEHGPRELDIRLTRTQVDAEQLTLDLEAVQ